VNETTQVVLYGLIAGLSPLALLATLAVLGSGRGRLNGSLFALGFLLTQSTVLLIAVLLGAAATPDRDRGHETLAAALGLAAGVGLIALAARQRSSGDSEEPIGGSRTEAFLARLGRLRSATAFSLGALLGVGGVKRLTLTLLAGASIALAGLIPAEELALGIVYVALASALVTIPVVVYLIAGRHADAWTASTQAWLIRSQQGLTILSTLVFGVLIIGHSLLMLVA
jgi:hypothetical protein